MNRIAVRSAVQNPVFEPNEPLNEPQRRSICGSVTDMQAKSRAAAGRFARIMPIYA